MDSMSRSAQKYAFPHLTIYKYLLFFKVNYFFDILVHFSDGKSVYKFSSADFAVIKRKLYF